MRARAIHTTAALGLALVACVLAVPAGSAPTWLQPPTPLSTAAVNSFGPAVALDAAGNATAVWTTLVTTPTSHNIVQAAYRPAGGTWSAPVQVSTATDTAFNSETPDLAVSADGTAVVVYSTGNFPGGPYGVKAATRPAGGAWSEPVTLLSTGTFFAIPVVTMDPAGNATALWRTFTGGGRTLDTSSLSAGGSAWTPAEPLDALTNTLHDVAAGPDGTVVAVWPVVVDGVNVIRARVRPPGGTWGDPLTISSPGVGDSDRPMVASGADGGFTVAWQRTTGLGGPYYVQAASRSPGGAWGAAGDVSVPSMTEPHPQVTVDATGTATVVWHRYDGVSYNLRASQRVAGGDWAPGVDVSSAGGFVSEFRIAESTGTARVVWDRGNGITGKVYDASKAPGGPWTTEAPLTDGTASPGGLALAGDPAGNLLAAWVQGSPSVVQALPLDAAGPVISAFTAAAGGREGRALPFTAAASDVWSQVSSYHWTFGDGHSADGPGVVHRFRNAGKYVVTLTVTDSVGNTTTRSATTLVKAPKPVIKVLSLTDNTIRAGERTKLKVKLNTRATLKLVFKGKVHGVKAKLSKKLPKGTSKLTLTTKVGKKILVPDTYVVVVTARNGTGTSKPKKITLKVVR